MAYRKRRGSAERVEKPGRRGAKTRNVTMNLERNLGELPQPTVVQLPVQPMQLPSACALMQWGTSTPGSGTNFAQGGPAMQVNVAPPVVGTFAGISALEFTQYWGVQNAAGSYFLPASINLNINFDLVAWASTPQPWAWCFWDLYPGMFKRFVRIFSKARIIRATGEVEECWFEAKNFIPFFGYGYPCVFDSDGNNTSYLQCPTQGDIDGWASGLSNYYHFYVGLNQYPIEKCLWKLQGLTFHSPNQSPAEVNPGPSTPFPYGPDNNFGLDMNASLPVTNNWNYGDRIIIEGVNAQVNPYWGITQCSYEVGIDGDNDGIIEDFYSGTEGATLATMVPSAQIQLEID